MKWTTTSVRLAPSRRLLSGGFTLLELLIALTIGLVVLAAALSVYVASSRSSQLSQVETQLNEDGILALNLIQQQLKVAGYSRQIIPSNGATVMGNYAGLAVRGCDGGFVNAGAAFASLTCATDSSGSDAIAVRYEATTANTTPTSASLPENCIGNGIVNDAVSQASPAPAPAPAPYALADNRYMVTDLSTQPMLSCRGAEKNGNTAANSIGTSQPLLANVENMQILYGVASRPSAELAATYDPMRHQIVSYLSASEINALTSTGSLPSLTDDQWGRVLSVRICLLMRSEQTVRDVPVGGFAYKDCKNVDATGADGYLRKTYTTTVLLRNRVIIP